VVWKVLPSGLTPLSEICNDFECMSSPAVEGSLRQIAKDIVSLKEAGVHRTDVHGTGQSLYQGGGCGKSVRPFS